MNKMLLSTCSLAVLMMPTMGVTQILAGDNQSGLEFGYSCPTGTPTANCTGTLGKTYTIPDPTHAITVLHANVIRLPFLIERAQPTANGALDTAGYMNSIKKAATKALDLGAQVVLDPHDFGYVYGDDISSPTGEAAYLDFEQRFNTWIVANFTPAQAAMLSEGLMNEPHTQSDATYQPIFQQAIEVIRAAGFKGTLTYPAARWSGIQNISADSTFMQGVTDPENKLVAEFHGYWDADSSGTHNTCITDPNLGHTRLDGAIAWSNRTGIKIFWGETGEPEPTPQPAAFSGCYIQSDANFRSFMQEAFNSGRFYAITFWGDGPWWGGKYLFDLAPVSGAETADALTLQSLIAQNANGLDSAAWYTVRNTNSGLCLDDAGGSTANGTLLLQWDCGSGKLNQEWQFTPTSDGYYRVATRSGPVVWDVTGGPSAVVGETRVQLWTFEGNTNQQWQPVPLGNGSYKFVARNSGLCLDVPQNSTMQGTQLQQYSCNGTSAQSFTLAQP